MMTFEEEINELESLVFDSDYIIRKGGFPFFLLHLIL